MTQNPRIDTAVIVNLDVTATFAINTYTLTYSHGPNGTVTGSSPQTVNYGDSSTEVVAVPNLGYHFVGWSDAPGTDHRTDTNVTSDLTVTASFAINTYTLTYVAGSQGSLSGTTTQVVNYGASGSAVTAVPDVRYHFVNWGDNSTQNPRTDTNVTSSLSVTANFAINAGATGGGGGSVVSAVPAVTVRTPSSGSYNADAVVGLEWSSSNGAFTKYRVSYSADNGATWSAIADNVTQTALSWTVPDTGTTLGKIRVEGYDATGSLLATGLSNGAFTVVGEAPGADVNENPLSPPATSSSATGTYVPAEALENNPDIDTDKGIDATAAASANCVAGTLIKGSLSAVYYCGADGKRYVFTTSRVYFSWYVDFSQVLVISDAELASVPLGGNATYRPGKLMVKVQTDPKVYAVSRGGLLRWIPTEAKAKELYGANWNKMIDYIPDAFFVDYKIGAPIP